MIKLDSIVKAVERMTDALNNVSKAIHRAVDYLESNKKKDSTDGMGRGW